MSYMPSAYEQKQHVVGPPSACLYAFSSVPSCYLPAHIIFKSLPYVSPQPPWVAWSLICFFHFGHSSSLVLTLPWKFPWTLPYSLPLHHVLLSQFSWPSDTAVYYLLQARFTPQAKDLHGMQYVLLLSPADIILFIAVLTTSRKFHVGWLLCCRIGEVWDQGQSPRKSLSGCCKTRI